MSSIKARRPLRERMARWNAAATLAWVRAHGVALTVLSGLVLIGLLALTQSGVAIFAVARFGASFNQVANTNLPNLIAASRLSELSQSLTARAPEMAAATTQTQRQGIVDRLDDRLTALAGVLNRFDKTATDPDQLRDLRSQLDLLATNMHALDGFVRQRIDADNAFATVMARLPVLATRVRLVAETALIGGGDGEPRSEPPAAIADRPRLIAWSAAGLEGITLMLGTPAVDTKSRLERVRAELQTLITRMENARSQLPVQVRQKIDGMHNDIAQFGLGDQSIFQARQLQIEAGTAIQTSLQLIDQNIDKFLGSVSVILKATQQEIGGRAASLNQTVSYFNLLIIGIGILCLVAGAAIFAFVRRSVITRLKDVQEYMGSQVDGRPAAISPKGTDEIAKIAKATQVFVARIASREAALHQRTDELSAALDRQRAIAELLGVITSSLGNLSPVFDEILEKALRLCEAAFGSLWTCHEGLFDTIATRNRPAVLGELARRAYKPTPESALGRLVAGEPFVHVADAADDPSYRSGNPSRRALVDLAGVRTYIAVPLRKGDTLLGAITMYRREVRPFTEKQIELVESFAAQAVIAIENGRLLSELRTARDAAEKALGELRTAQASLIYAEKMASLGQLTAGITHEIKNPLNFVNNFAGLSVELLNELKAVAAPGIAALDEDARSEIEETIAILTGNLEKIAEHGHRADGIVKSMLEHSRGGTGDRRNVDLNALVDEALNLAYHGARANDPSFNITLERVFDDALAPIDVVPQDLTRVFLNLIGNGFYAAAKKNGSRPVLKVMTRDLGEAVEIRVRDNGIGIALEVRDKLFQPFVTTKPTG